MPKPKDFTDSAVQLCNPVEVKELLEKLSPEQDALKALEDELKASNTKLVEKIATQSGKVADLQQVIRGAIDQHGSYQDLENERYGVKYERKTPVYDNIVSFKKNFAKFAELCIKETIDVNALRGQIKGKLITEKQLEDAGVLLYELSTSFYVR